MKEKLQLLMKTEGLKPGQLAEMLEVYPSVVSHILAGRNKVSLELSQKILRRFPRINPDWLILGTGEMYRETPAERAAAASATAEKNTDVPSGENLSSLVGQPSVSAVDGSLFDQPSIYDFATDVAAQKPANSIARIIILYTDRTFESFTPSAQK